MTFYNLALVGLWRRRMGRFAIVFHGQLIARRPLVVVVNDFDFRMCVIIKSKKKILEMVNKFETV